MYGDEALLFAMKALIKSIDFHDDKPQSNLHKIQLIQQFMDDIIHKPHYCTLMGRSFESVSEELVPRIAKVLKFKLSQDIAFAISLSRSPNAGLASAGKCATTLFVDFRRGLILLQVSSTLKTALLT